MENPGYREGGCLCGGVRFRAPGEPTLVAHCHCDSCRRFTGAAVATFADYSRNKVEIEGKSLKCFQSSPGASRMFCGACGAAIAFRGDNHPDEISLHLGAFDQPESLTPEEEDHTEERLEWVKLAAL